jgi:serine/threonine protein kinase
VERSAGATVCGRLELLREESPTVGVQVFGPTWVVLDGQSGELARACLLDDELLPTQELRDAFVAAAAELGQLRDPALVPQLFAGADSDGGAVLYEPVSGGVAFDELYDGTGSYELAVEVGRLARQLARALAALHQRGLVHGMLTAAAVFVGPRGPSVYQYGLAPLCDRTVLMRRVRAFDLAGVAPEIHAGGSFTPAADLYAWAVAVAQFAAGARGPAAISAIQSGQDLPGLSPGLRAALQACLAEAPGGRPQDATELLRRLDSSGLGDASGMILLSQAPELAEAIATPAPTAPASSPVSATPATPATSAPPVTTTPSRPPTMPPPPRPPGAKDRPPTVPPTGMTIPVTSFEEMLMTGDRQRRPPPPAPVAAAARPAIELSPEDLMHESGAWNKQGQPTGKSASNLRRVHVLTDPVKREVSGPAPEGLAPAKPAGEVIIGGTREDLEAAGRATTVKLEPADAASAVKAANLAHSTSGPLQAADPVAPPRPAETEAGHLEVPATTPATGDSARRRNADTGTTEKRTEPQDWGKIPTMKHPTVNDPPVHAPVDDLVVQKPPLALYAAAGGLILLIILIFSC